MRHLYSEIWRSWANLKDYGFGGVVIGWMEADFRWICWKTCINQSMFQLSSIIPFFCKFNFAFPLPIIFNHFHQVFISRSRFLPVQKFWSFKRRTAPASRYREDQLDPRVGQGLPRPCRGRPGVLLRAPFIHLRPKTFLQKYIWIVPTTKVFRCKTLVWIRQDCSFGAQKRKSTGNVGLAKAGGLAKERVLGMNASDERGINSIREKVFEVAGLKIRSARTSMSKHYSSSDINYELLKEKSVIITFKF